MRYAFIQHTTSGDIFAVRLDEERAVIGSVGPIDVDELAYDPSDFIPNMSDDGNEWFMDQDAHAGGAGAFRIIERATLP